VREKYCWLVTDKPSEQGDQSSLFADDSLLLLKADEFDGCLHN
jgi:hypothetical protein